MPDNALLFAVFALSGTAMVVLAVLDIRVSWAALAWPARAAVLFFCLAPLIQLVPLPPAIWRALPGRALSAATLDAAGVGQNWRPLTLSVLPTLRSLLVFTWLAAFLLVLLRLPTSELRRLLGAVLVLALIHVTVGIVQVVSGGTVLNLYGGPDARFLTGLFANKNHSALFIALSFPAGYAALYGEQGWDRRRLALVAAVVLVLFAALLATFSRAGLVLGVVALGCLLLLRAGERAGANARNAWVAGGAVLAGAALLAVLGSTQVATQALARFGGVSDDLRWSIWRWTWPLVVEQFPTGAGIGSFTAVFPSHEQLAWVKPTVVNHVHNDYLEQLIELGIAAPLFWLLALVALAGPMRSAWAGRERQSGRLGLVAATMLVLIAMHSAVDYPLRRPAIAATAMVALACVLRLGGRKSRLHPMTGYARQAV